MNILALPTLSRTSALDPEPSYWAKQHVTEMEEQLFTVQDDHEPWPPAFVRRAAQLLDRAAKVHPFNRPQFGPEPTEYEQMLTAVRAAVDAE